MPPDFARVKQLQSGFWESDTKLWPPFAPDSWVWPCCTLNRTWHWVCILGPPYHLPILLSAQVVMVMIIHPYTEKWVENIFCKRLFQGWPNLFVKHSSMKFETFTVPSKHPGAAPGCDMSISGTDMVWKSDSKRTSIWHLVLFQWHGRHQTEGGGSGPPRFHDRVEHGYFTWVVSVQASGMAMIIPLRHAESAWTFSAKRFLFHGG